MVVETFEVEEQTQDTQEIDKEAQALVESLELEGQRRYFTEPQEGEEVRRIPYRELTAAEEFTYGVLCPTRVEADRYSAGPMPLRVLQVLAHAKSTGFFDEGIQVWSATGQIKDPVLVGVAQEPGKSYQKNRFLLARWGEELETFEVLLQKALRTRRKALQEHYASIAAKATAKAKDIGLTDEEMVAKGPTSGPSYYDH